MGRRLFAFVLTLIVGGAPVAGNICDVLCVDHAGHSAQTSAPMSHHHHGGDAATQGLHHHHSDAPMTTATASVTLTPASHHCVQADGVLTESRELSGVPVLGVVTSVAVVGSTLDR